MLVWLTLWKSEQEVNHMKWLFAFTTSDTRSHSKPKFNIISSLLVCYGQNAKRTLLVKVLWWKLNRMIVTPALPISKMDIVCVCECLCAWSTQKTINSMDKCTKMDIKYAHYTQYTSTISKQNGNITLHTVTFNGKL